MGRWCGLLGGKMLLTDMTRNVEGELIIAPIEEDVLHGDDDDEGADDAGER